MFVSIHRCLVGLLFLSACSADAAGTQPDVRQLTTQGDGSPVAADVGLESPDALWLDSRPGDVSGESEFESVSSGDGEEPAEDQVWIQPDPSDQDRNETTSGPTQADRDCRSQFNPDAVDPDFNPVLFVLEAVDVAKADDQRCGARSIEDRTCRALWMLEVLDPLTLGYDPSLVDAEREDAANALDWALKDAVEAQRLASGAGSELPGAESALSTMVVLSRSISLDVGQVIANDVAGVVDRAAENRLAELIVARADPLVLEPLIGLADVCQSVSREG